MIKALSGTVIELLAFAAIIALLMGGGWGRVETKERSRIRENSVFLKAPKSHDVSYDLFDPKTMAP